MTEREHAGVHHVLGYVWAELDLHYPVSSQTFYRFTAGRASAGGRDLCV